MQDSPTKYHALPTPEDQTYHPQADVREAAGNDGDDPDSTSERILAEDQTKWTYFLLGCAILLPWNALVNGMSFFLSRMAGSPFYPTFSSYLSSVYMLIKLFCQFYSTITSKQSSPSRRIIVSISAMILLVISLWLSTYFRGTPSTFFSFALFNAAALAVSTGYLCTATYAGAALLGTPFLRNALSGQAAIAVAAGILQVVSSMISLWGSSPPSTETKRTDGGDTQAEEGAARIFFGVSAVFLGITLVAYMWLTRQSRYRSVARTLEQHREVAIADELTGLVADDCSVPHMETKLRVYQVCRKNFVFMFSISYVYIVTLAVFPAITARVQSVNPGFHPLLFTAIHVLACNAGDLAGRYTCVFTRLLRIPAKRILAMSLLRTLFIPLILACNIHRPEPIPSAATTPLVSSDALFMLIMLAMGYTNGFVACLATLVVSSVEHNPRLGGREDVDLAAALSGSFTIVGLAVGALCSFAVQAMI